MRWSDKEISQQNAEGTLGSFLLLIYEMQQERDHLKEVLVNQKEQGLWSLTVLPLHVTRVAKMKK